jgi:hypothetical protein
VVIEGLAGCERKS